MLAGLLLWAPAASAQPAKRAPNEAELNQAAVTVQPAKPAPNEADLAEAATKPAAAPSLPAKTIPFEPGCPGCPAGFVCSKGVCGTKPRLVCPGGYVRFGEICALEREGAPGQADLEEQRLMAIRLLQRARPKLTLDLQGGFVILAPTEWPARASVVAPTGMLLFGRRQNFQEKLGVAYRGGLLLGMPILQSNDTTTTASGSDSDSTFMTGLILEAMPYFGPYGRFYVGPLVFVGAMAYGNNDLHAGATETRFHLANGFMGGAGVGGGFLAGDYEQTDLNVTLRLDFNPEHKMTLFLMAGVGLHRLWGRASSL